MCKLCVIINQKHMFGCRTFTCTGIFLPCLFSHKWNMFRRLNAALCLVHVSLQLYPDTVRYELAIEGRNHTILLEKNRWVSFLLSKCKYYIYVIIYKYMKMNFNFIGTLLGETTLKHIIVKMANGWQHHRNKCVLTLFKWLSKILSVQSQMICFSLFAT